MVNIANEEVLKEYVKEKCIDFIQWIWENQQYLHLPNEELYKKYTSLK